MQTVSAAYLLEHPLPDHDAGSDKHQRGRVLVIGGSVEIPGAAYLASLAALRAGAGVLQIATCATAAPHLGLAMPEARVIPCPETSEGGIHPASLKRVAEAASTCDAILIGPGMVDQAAIAELTEGLLKKTLNTKIVLDAEAFVQARSLTDELSRHRGRVVLTPHSGEMAKFLALEREKVERDPVLAAQRACDLTGAVIILKGACTHILDPSGEHWLCEHGCIGLATSGSGDTLAGILAGLLARGAGLTQAAYWSVFLHAEAGQRLTARCGRLGFLARELPDQIPRIMDDLSKRD